MEELFELFLLHTLELISFLLLLLDLHHLLHGVLRSLLHLSLDQVQLLLMLRILGHLFLLRLKIHLELLFLFSCLLLRIGNLGILNEFCFSIGCASICLRLCPIFFLVLVILLDSLRGSFPLRGDCGEFPSFGI